VDSAFKYRDFSEVEMTNGGLLTEIASYGHLSLAALRQAQDKLCRNIHSNRPFDHRSCGAGRLRVTIGGTRTKLRHNRTFPPIARTPSRSFSLI